MELKSSSQLRILSFFIVGLLMIFLGAFLGQISYWNFVIKFLLFVFGLWYLTFVFLVVFRIKNIIRMEEVKKINMLLWPIFGISLFVLWLEDKMDKDSSFFQEKPKGGRHEI